MLDADEPTLGVGFAIETGNSFEELLRLQQVMDTTEAKVVAQAAKIEQATGGMVDLGNARAAISSFGSGATREMAAAAREIAKAEKAGEALSRQMDRQSSTFGKSKEEIRQSKVETAALAAEQAGLTELAGRLRLQLAGLVEQERAAAIAAEEQARVMREAAHAHQLFEARARAGAQAMREQEEAERNLAARTMALKAAIDPAFAAQQRFDREIAEARSLIAAGAISLDDYAKRHVQLQNELKRSSGAMEEQVRSTGMAKAGMQQLNFQLGDMATMYAMGAAPMQIFSSQAGQLFQALGMIAEGGAAAGKGAQTAGDAADQAGSEISEFGDKAIGVAEKVNRTHGRLAAIASFMTGPWGAAITVGMAVLAPFIAKMLDFGDSVDDAVDKLKEQAKEAEITRAAQERFKSSAEGVAAAIRDGNEASRSYVENMRTAAEQANINAKAELNRELSIRRATKAELEQAKVAAERNAQNALSGDAYDVVAKRISDGRVAELQARLQEQEALIRAAESRVGVTRIELATEAAKRAVDPIARINKLYDDQMNAARRAAVARAQAGQAITAQLTRELAQIETNRKAALKAEQDRQGAARQTQAQIGRTITLLEARSIAEGIGGRVTSTQRSTAKQQELYDKYMAYKNGTGPWAALAAKPGTSNHEKGLALDVAKTDGMTLKKLVAAYRAAGVKLTEALDEGSHFHIAWSAGKAVTEAAKEADRIGDWLQDQRTTAQGNVWNLMQEVQERQREWGKGDPTWNDTDVQKQQDADALQQAATDNARDALAAYMDQLDAVSDQVDRVASNMRDAFGSVGGAIGGMITVLDEYGKRQAEIAKKRELGLLTAQDEAALQKRAALDQIGLYGDMASAAKGFFKEGSSGYKAMETAEKAFRAVEFALSVRAMAQDAIETASSIAKSGARTATKAVEAVVSAISSLPFPLNLVAGAATIAALASIGVAIAGSFGGGGSVEKPNEGTGTVLGDSSAKSESIKRSIDALKEVDLLMLGYSRQMAASLQSIESQIGGFAALLVRQGDSINASGGVNVGFKKDLVGSLLGSIPILGGILGGLFGTKTTIKGTGLYGRAQSLEDILSGGFDASYYTDVNKKKKAFGITYSNKNSTKYSAADPMLENQFTLILSQFNDAILAAAGPLGASTGEIERKLNGFVVNLGKINLKGLTGEEIEEKLNAVFGAAADNMANAAFPGMQKFQKVGEGLFETLVRVASTVESVTSSLTMLGSSALGMSIDLKMSLADQFESLSDFTSAVGTYFETYYSKEEQVAARTTQFAATFKDLGLSMPASLAGFRALVEAQDLTTAAGQATYATLLQLAPAFADLQSAMTGAKSAADVLSERQDLERRMLELQGNIAAIRALELSQLDESNRALQQQIWAIEDAKEAAAAADQLRQAWSSVGNSIMEEVKRIRGITDGSSGSSFATLQGEFNAATAAARGGDQDAANRLVSLSQAMLNAATLSATSKQELDRVKAMAAASLEQTHAILSARGGIIAATGSGSGSPASTLNAAAYAQAATPSASNDNMAAELRALRQEVAQLRSDNNAGHAISAGNTGRIARTLDDVTAASGGEAVSVAGAAA